MLTFKEITHIFFVYIANVLDKYINLGEASHEIRIYFSKSVVVLFNIHDTFTYLTFLDCDMNEYQLLEKALSVF